MKHRPQPKSESEPILVPAGQILHDSPKTSFVDFRRLMATLEREGYTGYLHLITDDASGLVLFRDGTALECVYSRADKAGVVLGKEALQMFSDVVDEGDGVLDVIGLSPEVIDGLYQLTASRPIYTELYAGWVDVRALLKYLSDRKLNGSVVIRAAAGTGIIVLADGQVASAYTSESRDIADQADKAVALCDDPDATIEVKSADTTKHPPLDIADIDARKGSRIGRGAGSEELASDVAEPVAPTNSIIRAMPSEPPATQIPTSSSPSVTDRAFQPGRVLSIRSVRGAESEQDFAAILAELQALAEEALGNRARKVKDLLGAADPSVAGIADAIDQIPHISLLFVDFSRPDKLAREMRDRFESHL